MGIQLISPVFDNGQQIPENYTCDGQNVSPPLQWSKVPQGTQSFALICDDPDAAGGTWVHWVLYNLPASTQSLSEAIPPDENLGDGSLHGKNDWRRLGYGGPCPPAGTHRYFFRLYALDTMLDLAAGATKIELMKAMEKHILAQAQLMGRYSR